MRFTDSELALLRSTFKGNEPLILLLRKIFLPEIDPQAPIGQLVDLWMVKNYAGMTPEDVKINIIARQDLIMHVESQLLQIKVLAEQTDETIEEVAARLNKDSGR